MSLFERREHIHCLFKNFAGIVESKHCVLESGFGRVIDDGGDFLVVLFNSGVDCLKIVGILDFVERRNFILSFVVGQKGIDAFCCMHSCWN